jgi:hypothetical protein
MVVVPTRRELPSGSDFEVTFTKPSNPSRSAAARAGERRRHIASRPGGACRAQGARCAQLLPALWTEAPVSPFAPVSPLSPLGPCGPVWLKFSDVSCLEHFAPASVSTTRKRPGE